MRQIKIPVPAIIISALFGLSLGIAFEYSISYRLFPRVLLIFLVLSVSVGSLLQLIFWIIARRRKPPLLANLENLPVSIKDLLYLVIKDMRYRKSVRLDVTAELAAHFEDELRGCKDEKEKEQKAKKLIEEFGDSTLLGVLLRRAKKRCRPFWRTVVVRAFQTAGVLIFCLIVYIFWFSTGKPVISTDYVAEFNRLVRPSADESQNALPIYEKTIKLLKSDSDYNDIQRILLGKKNTEPNSAEKDKIEKFTSVNSEAFDLVIEGSKKPYFWMTYRRMGSDSKPSSFMMGLIMPNLFDFGILARLLCWRAIFLAEKGNYQDSFENLVACYRLGQQIRTGHKTLTEQFNGMAIEERTVQAINIILGGNRIESSILTSLQKDMEKTVSGEDFVMNITYEKLNLYDIVQRYFTEDKYGGHLYVSWYGTFLGMATSPKKTIHILFTHPGKTASIEQIEKFNDLVEEFSIKTPFQIHIEKRDFEKEFKKIVESNVLLRVLTPQIGNVTELCHRNKIQVQATVAIIALQRYKQDTGEYPDNLQELISAGYIKELPIDPWSDKTLVYKRIDTGFTLYSVGLNFKDDGGVIARDGEGRIRIWDRNEGDAVFWPVGK